MTAAGAALWGAHHALTAVPVLEGHETALAEIYLGTFALLLWQVALFLLDRPRKAPPEAAGLLAALQVVIAVPCYNEDPAILLRALLSMIRQTRLPDMIFVVDDGSDKADYTAVRAQFEAAARRAGVATAWHRTPNQGKRHAHAVAVRATPGADVYVTVDSDGILDKRAVGELLIPFADPSVMSCAGILLQANNRGPARPAAARGNDGRLLVLQTARARAAWRASQLLARVTDLLYVTSQLTARSSLSVMGSVLVNSGVLAAYRADVIRDALPVYLGETFFGRPIEYSDDSLMTLLAHLRGKTVQQPSAFVFTALPDRYSHHARQYLRWMRGSFVRSWWRFKYLPLRSYAYWWHLLSWILTVISLGAFADVYVGSIAQGRFRWTFLLVPVLLGYGMNLRYLTVRRSDQSFASQVLTWLLSPAGVLWSFTVLRAWRWYGAATWFKTGWGTRSDIEVTLEDPNA